MVGLENIRHPVFLVSLFCPVPVMLMTTQGPTHQCSLCSQPLPDDYGIYGMINPSRVHATISDFVTGCFSDRTLHLYVRNNVSFSRSFRTYYPSNRLTPIFLSRFVLYLRHTIKTEGPGAFVSVILLPDTDMRYPTFDGGEPPRLPDLELDEKIGAGGGGLSIGDIEEVDRVVRPGVDV